MAEEEFQLEKEYISSHHLNFVNVNSNHDGTRYGGATFSLESHLPGGQVGWKSAFYNDSFSSLTTAKRNAECCTDCIILFTIKVQRCFFSPSVKFFFSLSIAFVLLLRLLFFSFLRDSRKESLKNAWDSVRSALCITVYFDSCLFSGDDHQSFWFHMILYVII